MTRRPETPDPDPTPARPAVARMLGMALEAERTMGPFRLIRSLGEGGMGSVWEAEQEEPIQRRVALKVIREGIAGPQALARFELERQALALMDHPRIAKVFDAGFSATGLPYFAMELVEGSPLTDFCREHDLSLPERLDLFVQACDAVSHAHGKGVIHRDLKPSNILTHESSERPSVTIIDFGIAKAVDPRLRERADLAPDLTQNLQLLGTPSYMSPEQLARGHAGVDVRSDVYSLGVVLYELLTDRLPFDEQIYLDPSSLRQRIEDHPPPRPSLAPGASKRLGSSSTDLDWIVAKALESDPNRRYASVAELQADVTRFVESRPVLARPPSRLDHLAKFVRRNRVASAAAALLLAMLVSSVVAISLALVAARRSADDARRAAAESEEAQRFLVDVFAQADPLENRGSRIEAGEMLEQGRQRIEKQLQDQPVLRARLLASLGDIYLHLGEPIRAGELLEEAATAAASVRAERADLSVLALRLKADALLASGQAEEALAVARGALDEAERRLEEGAPETLFASRTLGRALMAQGLLSEALPALVTALDGLKALEPRPAVECARTRVLIAEVQRALGRATEAADQLAAASTTFDEVDPGHPELPWVLNSLAQLAGDRGDLDQAEDLLQRSLSIQTEVFGENHPYVAHTLNDLGGVAWGRTDPKRARDLWTRSLEIRRALFDGDHPSIAQSLSNLGLAHRGMNELETAERFYREALEMQSRIYGPRHVNTANTAANLSLLLARERLFEEAEPLARRAAESAEEAQGPTSIRTMWAQLTWARVLRAGGDFAASERRLQVLRRALDEAEAPPVDLAFSSAIENLELATLGDSIDRDRLGQLVGTLPEPDSPERLLELHLRRAAARALLGELPGARSDLQRFELLASEQDLQENTAPHCYREARARSLLGDAADAARLLECALRLGWADFPPELDPALTPVHGLPVYRQLVIDYDRPYRPGDSESIRSQQAQPQAEP